MAEPMTVMVEVWPVAADGRGLWLISGEDAWRPDLVVMADEDIHANVELEMWRPGLDHADVPLLHSTSWHQHWGSAMHTYMAMVRQPGYVVDNWPGAMPISTWLPGEVGQPLRHDPAEPPNPRYIDVMLHGLRHLLFLQMYDDDHAAKFDGLWRRHLEAFTPALAKMYRRDPVGCPR
jgi:hypothetical protein